MKIRLRTCFGFDRRLPRGGERCDISQSKIAVGEPNTQMTAVHYHGLINVQALRGNLIHLMIALTALLQPFEPEAGGDVFNFCADIVKEK